MLNNYYTTPLEDWITDMYNSIGVFEPVDLEEDVIAKSLCIDLYYQPFESTYMATDIMNYIAINNRNSYIKQRQDFFHELCHVLRHTGIQAEMNRAFRQLQEEQTNQFVLYAMMPFSMISNLELPNYEAEVVALLSSKFKVSLKLAKQRLEQIKLRALQSQWDFEIKERQKRLYRKADPANWSNETKALLQIAVERKIMKEGILK